MRDVIFCSKVGTTPELPVEDCHESWRIVALAQCSCSHLELHGVFNGGPGLHGIGVSLYGEFCSRGGFDWRFWLEVDVRVDNAAYHTVGQINGDKKLKHYVDDKLYQYIELFQLPKRYLV